MFYFNFNQYNTFILLDKIRSDLKYYPTLGLCTSCMLEMSGCLAIFIHSVQRKNGECVLACLFAYLNGMDRKKKILR